MSTITTRSGKGSPLTNNEVDANFTNLNTDKLESGDLSVVTTAVGTAALAYNSGVFTYTPPDLTAIDLSLYAPLAGAVFTGNVEAPLFEGNLTGAILFKGSAGEALTKGDPVYISGISGNKTVVSKADANDANKMPCFGIVNDTVSLNADCSVVTFGTLQGMDTSSFSEGDELYISDTGTLTATAPTGEASQIQKIGKVTRSHASTGSIKVMGAGRTNATPNLNDGNFFLGNASNQAVSADFTTAVRGEISAGTGIGLSGGVISNTAPDQTVALTGAGATSISGTYPNFTITSTDTVYTLPFADNSANWNTAYGWGDHASQSYATQSYVGTAISNLVDSSPATLDTLNELAAALGDDPNFATTVTNSIALKAPLASPSFTGTATMDGLVVDGAGDGVKATIGKTGGTNLNIYADTNTVYLAGSPALSTAYIIDQTNNNMQFKVNAAERMRIDSSGNVNVGCTDGNSLYNNSGTNDGVGVLANGQIQQAVYQDVVHYVNRTGNDGTITSFQKDGATVGSIGTGNGGNLYIGSGDAGINFNPVVNSIYPINAGTGGGSDAALDLGLAGAYRFRDLHLSGVGHINGEVNVLSAGTMIQHDYNNLGSYVQEIRGDDRLLTLATKTNDSNAGIVFEIHENEKARFDNSGNLLVGKSGTAFGTAGVEASASNGLWSTRSGLPALALNRLSTDGSIADFYKDGTSVGSIGTLSGRMAIGTGNTGLFFDSIRQVLTPHTMTGNTYSTTIDLGRSIIPFKDLYLSGSARASIFYDSDNTGYYVDPNSTSRIATVKANELFTSGQVRATGWWGQTTGGFTSHAAEIGASGTTAYLISYSRDTGAYGQLNIEGYGISLTSTASYVNTNYSFRAPVFYDSDNTGYYVDPAGISNLSNIMLGGAAAPNLSSSAYWNAAFQVRESAFNGAGTDNYIQAPRLAFHWSGRVASQIGLQSSGRIAVLDNPGSGYADFAARDILGDVSMRSPIYYDSANTSYYVDPTSTSILVSATFDGNITVGNASTASYITMGDSDQGARVIHCNSDRIGFLNQAGSWGAWCDDNGYWRAGLLFGETSTRSPIYYDYNDTGYYVDPNGTSNLINLTVANTITGNAATATKATDLNQARYVNTDFNTLGTSPQVFRAYTNYIPSGGAYNQPTSSGDFKVIQWGDVDSGSVGNWGGQIVQNFYDDRMWFRRSFATTWQAWREFIHDGNYTNFAMPIGSSATNSVDVRAPIFYDSNNTGYYVDPAGASILGQLSLNSVEGLTKSHDKKYHWNSPVTISNNVNPRQTQFLRIYYCPNHWTGDPINLEVELRSKYYENHSSSYTIQQGYNQNDPEVYVKHRATNDTNIRLVQGATTSAGYNYSGQPVYYTDFYIWCSTYRNAWAEVTATSGFYTSAPGAGVWGATVVNNNNTTYIDNPPTPALTNPNFGSSGLISSMSVHTQGIYDSDNTGYYVDPASTSNVNALSVSGNLTLNFSRLYFAGAGDNNHAINYPGGTHVGETNGTQFRFYSYLNLYSSRGGTSVMTLKYDKSVLFNGNATIGVNGEGGNNKGLDINYGVGSGDYGRVRFYENSSNHNTIHSFSNAWQGGSFTSTSSGAINLTAYNGVTFGDWNNVSHYFGLNGTGYAKADFRAPIFYDSNNTGYYVDPNGASNLGGISGTVLTVTKASGANGVGSLFQNQNGDNSWGIVSEFRVASTASGYDRPSILFSSAYNTNTWSVGYGYSDDNFRINMDHGHRNGGWGTTALLIDRSSNVTASGSFRAPVFYDSNNTGYYVDPNSTSRFARIVQDERYDATNIATYGGFFTGDWQSLTNSIGQFNVVQVNDINGGAYSNQPPNVYTYGSILSWRALNHSFQLYAAHTGDLAYKTQWNNDNYTGWLYPMVYNRNNGGGGTVYGSLFYDSNDTNYYVDPNGTSSLNLLNVNTSGAGNGSPQQMASFVNVGTGATSSYATFSASSGVDWRVGKNPVGTAGNTNFGISTHVGALVHQWDGSGNSYASGSSRAPIFYDSNNTAYYVDPNTTGTSVNVAGDIIAGGRVYTGGTTTNFIGDGPYSNVNMGINFGSSVFFYAGATQLAFFSTQNAVFNRRLIIAGGTTETGTDPNITSKAQSSTNGVTQYHINFTNSSGTVHGRITSNNFSTTYATTSDYRVKEDLQEMENATSRLLQLKPINFKWIGSEQRTDGFLAHEVKEVVPDAVVGEKDATEEITDEEGITKTVSSLQALDQAKLVPLLVKTIQELEARISALENA